MIDDDFVDLKNYKHLAMSDTSALFRYQNSRVTSVLPLRSSTNRNARVASSRLVTRLARDDGRVLFLLSLLRFRGLVAKCSRTPRSSRRDVASTADEQRGRRRDRGVRIDFRRSRRGLALGTIRRGRARCLRRARARARLRRPRLAAANTPASFLQVPSGISRAPRTRRSRRYS